MTQRKPKEQLDYDNLFETSMRFALKSIESKVFKCHTWEWCTKCGTVCPFNVKMFGEAFLISLIGEKPNLTS